MTCAESQKWIDAYSDGELDLQRSLDIEVHLRTCMNCKARHDNLLALRKAFQQPSLRFAVPAGLESKLASTPQSRQPSARTAWSARPFAPLRWFAAGAAACALAATGLWQLPRVHPGVSPVAATMTMQDLLDSHLRSLEPGHLIDVVSTDQHTVKPWFNGKISFSPPVNNFADQGFPLIGGRLDYVGSQPAAVLVYRFNKHIINVYITLRPKGENAADSTTTGHGYHIDEWHTSDMDFAAVSDVNQDGLSRFVGLFQSREK